MMREEDEEFEVARPPAPHEQRFDSKIEADLGYVITDPQLKEEIADEVYNPKPKAEFGYDPTVDPSREGLPLYTLTSYATNTGTLDTDEAEKPTNLVASSLGYVMPKNMGDAESEKVEEEIDTKFGRRTPQDNQLLEEEEDSSSDEEERKKKKKDEQSEDSPHKPYAQLDTVEEDNEFTEHTRVAKARAVQGKGVDRIHVAVRLRPMTKDEMVSKNKKKKEGGPATFMAWDVEEDGDLHVLVQKGSRSKVEGKNMFHVDAVYEEQDKTDSLYSDICKPITTAVLNGLHGTIFGYGQTGGGKSYTIQGGKGVKGVIQLAAKDLFQRISEDSRREYSVKATYFEIYNEQVRDLMGHDESDDPKSRRATAVITTVNKLDVDLPVLSIREDAKGGDVFVNAQFTKVTSVENIKRVLHKGNRNRATEKTKANEFASRSHAIFRLMVESHEPIPEDADMNDGVKLRVAALNFVDLAGSENSAKAATSGKTKRDSGKINQSLLSLTQVIHQLSLPPKKRPKHINYRDSKLTRILQPHLSGNAAIAIICCCTPAKKMIEETRSALKFAYNAKRIKLKPQVNEVVDDKVLIENLKKELLETRMQLQNLKEFQEKNPPAPEGSGSEFPIIERFFALMNAHMNVSTKSEDFMDALEDLSVLSTGSKGADGRGGVDSNLPDLVPPAGGGEDAALAAADDEDDVEAFRRQILAKFMSEMENDMGDGDDDGDNADTTFNENTGNDVTTGGTTLGDATVGDAAIDGGETAVHDTSINRTDTAEIGATREPKEQAFLDPPMKAQQESLRLLTHSAPETSRRIPVTTPNQAQFETPSFTTSQLAKGDNRKDVFRSKPDSGLAFGESATLGAEVKRSLIDSDGNSTSTPHLPRNESDFNLIARFREEILEKFRDEIVDEEAAHELDENAQNVAVIANELINKFKREIVYKYKDEFPELSRDLDLAATRAGDNGIVGRVIERTAAVQSSSSEPQMNISDDSSIDGSVEKFEDEFDEEAGIGNADNDMPTQRRTVPVRSFSAQTDRAVIDGRSFLGVQAGKGPTSYEVDPFIPPIASSLGRSTIGSVSSGLSSDVADKKGNFAPSPLPLNLPLDTDDEDILMPPGEIAIAKGDGKIRIKFLEEKLLATDEVVETLFVELENAKTFIRELVFENVGVGGSAFDQSGAALFGSAGTSGVTVVDEQILNQCEILKLAIYTSLLFFVVGQHELFLATVFFLWLSLEVATKT